MAGEELQVAFAHQALGETEPAIALAEEFLRLYPDDRRRTMALALLAELGGDPDPAASGKQPGLTDLLEATEPYGNARPHSR